MNQHYWIRGHRRADRAAALRALDLPAPLAELDAHRRLRGPYTAAGSLIRLLADDLLQRCPELPMRHNIELLTSTPELAGRVPSARHTLEWAVADAERTRYYSRLHTRNIANGIAALLRDYLRARGDGPYTLVVENLEHADATDHEFVAVLLRRTDIGPLTIVACSGDQPIVDPPGQLEVSLVATLARHATLIDAAAGEPGTRPGSPAALAWAYVESDCTSDDPGLTAAYDRLDPAARAELHDARVTELTGTDEFSRRLGAVPFHAERGSDPTGAGVEALVRAMDHCRGVGLYQAAADLGNRGRALATNAVDKDRWWHFTEGTTAALAAVGRADEAEAIYHEARRASIDPEVHLDLAYGLAMLYARHYPEDQRDYDQARAWMNLTIALAGTMPDRKQRAFQSVFARNGLALVEVRQRQADEALRLLEEGMARLDEELAPDEHALHRAVLRYNRAQVYGGTGRWAEALADYSAVLEQDPYFPEHHFNVGNMLRQLGRNEEALASYQRVLDVSPPMPEAYYNLGDTRLELGDTRGAAADFDYVLELDPQHVDARINRAALRCDDGDLDGAWADVLAGLAQAPDNAYLWSLKGKVLAERGEADDAREALSAALRLDGSRAEAWAIRGAVELAAGNQEAAIRDLDRAVELDDSPDMRFNRALAHEEAGDLLRAIEDYDAILAVVDDSDARERREFCASGVSA